MTDVLANLDPFGRELHAALARRSARQARRRRAARVFAAATAVLAVAAGVAVASGAGLPLDPTKWEILGSGSVDNGRGEYVHARNKQTGAPSSFSVEHDAGMDRYDAFLLHERLRAAQDSTSPVPVTPEAGPLCTRDQLTRAESVGLATLRSTPNATRATVEAAIRSDFGDSPCRGIEYASEIAFAVFNGREPAANLMPGAR